MKHLSQKFKTYTVLTIQVLLVGLFSLNLTGCGSESDGFQSNDGYYGNYYNMNQWNSRAACNNNTARNYGIPGNQYCPYNGARVNGVAYAQIRVGAEILIDFGMNYVDVCRPDEVPVYEVRYGERRLVDCEYIGGSQWVDTIFYMSPNISACSGGYAGDRNCIPSGPSSYNNQYNTYYR